MAHILRLFKSGIEELIEASDSGRIEEVELNQEDSSNLDQYWAWYHKQIKDSSCEEEEALDLDLE